jgi:spore maturation protein CgeB
MTRVGVIGAVRPDDFADNLIFTLNRMGHQPISLGPAAPAALGTRYRSRAAAALRLSPAFLGTWQRRIVRQASASEVDVVITVDADLLPATVAELSTGCVPVALWFPDVVANIGRQLMLAAPYRAVFFKDRLLVRRLQHMTRMSVHYLPEACNPAWHRPSPRVEVDPVVVVAGNLYPSRVHVLQALHDAGVPLRLHGGGWPRWLSGFSVQSLPVLPEIVRDAKSVAFRRAAAVLNNLHPAEMDSVNCRLFEAAGAGAVVLCEDRPVLDELFDRPSELLTFSTVDELIDLARHALCHPKELTRLGDAAAARAHSEHTYEVRLSELLAVLG